MSNLGGKTLAILSLLVIVGFISIPFTHDDILLLVSYLIIFIGSYAFGTLIAKS